LAQEGSGVIAFLVMRDRGCSSNQVRNSDDLSHVVENDDWFPTLDERDRNG